MDLGRSADVDPAIKELHVYLLIAVIVVVLALLCFLIFYTCTSNIYSKVPQLKGCCGINWYCQPLAIAQHCRSPCLYKSTATYISLTWQLDQNTIIASHQIIICCAYIIISIFQSDPFSFFFYWSHINYACLTSQRKLRSFTIIIYRIHNYCKIQ